MLLRRAPAATIVTWITWAAIQWLFTLSVITSNSKLLLLRQCDKVEELRIGVTCYRTVCTQGIGSNLMEMTWPIRVSSGWMNLAAAWAVTSWRWRHLLLPKSWIPMAIMTDGWLRANAGARKSKFQIQGWSRTKNTCHELRNSDEL